jgi:hypothetical protein
MVHPGRGWRAAAHRAFTGDFTGLPRVFPAQTPPAAAAKAFSRSEPEVALGALRRDAALDVDISRRLEKTLSRMEGRPAEEDDGYIAGEHYTVQPFNAADAPNTMDRQSSLLDLVVCGAEGRGRSGIGFPGGFVGSG